MTRYNLLKLLFFVYLVVSSTAHASFNKNLWPIWEIHNPLSKTVIDHSKWQTFLDHCVQTNEEGINLVNYPNMQKTDVHLLHSYIKEMSKLNISQYNRAEQLAYWINLYNAVTIRTVISYYPIQRMDEINISPGLFSIGPWGAKLLTINKIELSLDEIQNRIIRPIWNDPRIHYALNNGAIGAPNLNKKAYTGDQIDAQLNEAAFSYINSLRGVQIIDGEIVASKIYEWFKEDFGGTDKGIITHIQQFAQQPLASQLTDTAHINNYIYNWHLNSTVSLS